MTLPPSERLERLEPDPRDPNAVRLVVNGRTAWTVPAEAVEAEGLVEGELVSVEAQQRLAGWADQHAAFTTAVRALGRRPFARRDLGRRLGLKGHPRPAIEAALDRAERLGFLNDEQYARFYIQSRSARGRGPARLRRELQVNGVAAGIIDRALAEETTDLGSEARIIELARTRARQLPGLERSDRFRRVVAFLARRGFSGAAVRRLVREAL